MYWPCGGETDILEYVGQLNSTTRRWEAIGRGHQIPQIIPTLSKSTMSRHINVHDRYVYSMTRAIAVSRKNNSNHVLFRF